MSAADTGANLGELIIRITNLPLPPSVNQVYATTRGGKRVMTQKGKTFKQQVRSRVGAECASRTDLVDLAALPLSLKIEIFLDTVVNKGWSTGKAKTRYKRVDTTNRQKLLEDAVSEALGIDDSQFFVVVASKKSGAPSASVSIYDYRACVSDHGVTEEYYEGVGTEPQSNRS